MVPLPNPIFCAAALTLCCCSLAVAEDDDDGPAIECCVSTATFGSDAEGGKANVVEVDVEIVGGAATPVVIVGVVGEVPAIEPVLIGAKFGETLAGTALAPNRLLMLPAESLAPCRWRGL